MVKNRQEILDILEYLSRMVHNSIPTQYWTMLRVFDENVRHIADVLNGKVERFGYPEKTDIIVVYKSLKNICDEVEEIYSNSLIDKYFLETVFEKISDILFLL